MTSSQIESKATSIHTVTKSSANGYLQISVLFEHLGNKNKIMIARMLDMEKPLYAVL